MLLEWKTLHHPNAHFLILIPSETLPTEHSALSEIWKNLMEPRTSESKKKISLFEICFKKIPPLATLYKTLFQWMRKISFSQAMVCSSNRELPNIAQIHMLLDTAKSQATDLNLGAYTLPFYKGFLVNFWAMPLAYLFGRAFRNPSTPDFSFSKACLEFWLTLPWPQSTQSFSMHLFLNVSASFSGLRLREIFLGRQENQDSYSPEENTEAIQVGLSLLDQHRAFLWNSTALLSPLPPPSTKLPFEMYTLTDLHKTLQTYRLPNTLTPSKTHMFRSLQKTLEPELSNTFFSYFEKNKKHSPLIPPWNKTLLLLFQKFLKQPHTQHSFKKIFYDLLLLKAAHWSEEIRRSIHTTKQRVLQDQNRGFPWVGGEKGQHWHIHDQFEKKLRDDYTQLHDIKRNYC
jgi:hypothetical protein